MSAQTYYTQTITGDGSSLALDDAIVAPAPYITYNCKQTVNLNFLFREVLFCDPDSISVNPDDPTTGSSKVHLVKTYDAIATAEADTDDNRVADVASTNGHFYAMRLINALLRSELGLDATEQAKVDAYIKHYGGYKDGLSGSSTNTNVVSTSTMDFGEFFQVALSAIRNKETDAAVSGVNGLVDRENINNAAVSGDIGARKVDSLVDSKLLNTMLVSANKSSTFANGVIDNNSTVNWMKQLLYSIISQSVSSGEADERYIPIRRTNTTADNGQERFMQLKLKNGDSVVLVFQFNLSDKSGNVFSNDRPDAAGTPMTIGFKIEHQDAAADFDLTETGTNGILPLGWEVVV